MTTNLQLSPSCWDVNAWRIVVRCGAKRAAERVLTRPIALIGSHVRCDVRVVGDHVPEVAYVVIALPSHIEVWPLAAIAFPRWGPIWPHQELLVGPNRITIGLPGANASAVPLEVPEYAVEARLRFRKGSRERVFRRHVTIVGADHPSAVRLHDDSLGSCDLAAVVVDRRLWLIDLVPGRWPDTGVAVGAAMPPIHVLDEPGARVQTPGVEFELLGVERQASGREAPVTATATAATKATANATEHLGVSVSNGFRHGVDGGRPLVGETRRTATPGPPDRGSGYSTTQPGEGRSLTLTKSVVPGDGSGHLSARVTERLVRINQSRFFRRRLIWATTSLLTVAIMVFVVLKIATGS